MGRGFKSDRQRRAVFARINQLEKGITATNIFGKKVTYKPTQSYIREVKKRYEFESKHPVIEIFKPYPKKLREIAVKEKVRIEEWKDKNKVVTRI